MREAAYLLVLRFVHYCPGRGDQVIKVYLECFQGSEDVQKTALAHAPDFSPFCYSEWHSPPLFSLIIFPKNFVIIHSFIH